MPFSETPTEKSKWILFEGVVEANLFNRFFTIYDKTDKSDPTKGNTGETWYKVLGYTDTIAEAQMRLFGRVTTESLD